ncbi:flagellar hook-associated protein FlgK [Arsukibacterium perlucidum]|uniref:flagellar hook-associated protein FlgK n=1 Tax=Arsukibacterium perlucidum TaxID=368811 RepID=UPI00036BC528|nr:flagellar hook-associated protein FlgK [Arsukibacterium perlucidum]
MSDNLLRIGTSAVLASSTSLNTTSNNIANLNTPGYVRQRTEFEAEQLGLGVGRGTTERLVSEFTLQQLRRDTTNLAYANQYVSEANRIDGLFSNPANSISSAVNDLFQKFQTANNDPSSISTRLLIISSSESLLDRFGTLSNLVLDQSTYINQQLELDLRETNSLIKNVADLNRNITNYGTGSSKPVPLNLYDKRDEAIRQLAEKLQIKVLDAANGEKLVFMATGQSLVIENGEFGILTLQGNPDPNVKELQLQSSARPDVIVQVGNDQLGGQLGALLSFRDETLIPTQNQLGQLALAMADSLNEQNKLGMTANGDIGNELFALPSFNGLNYNENTGAGNVRAVIEPGRAYQIPPNDFLVTFESPDTFTVEAVDSFGNVIPNSAISQTVVGFPATINAGSSPDDDLYGLQITLDASLGAFADGDRFLLKPLADAARQVKQLSNRAEDIALASPVRSSEAVDNLGNALVDKLVVTDTDPATSSFSPPAALTGAPFNIIYVGGNEFEVRDNADTVIGTTGPIVSATFDNILDRAGLNLGFDFNITGSPQPGDVFTIDYNTGGFNDNRNGLQIAALQTTDTMRRYAVTTPNADNQMSFNEAYGTMVSFVGDKTAQARNGQAAAEALYSQTQILFESLSGVSLDEEAANLVRFQQSYAAASRIISTSQTIFDTLLQAVR